MSSASAKPFVLQDVRLPSALQELVDEVCTPVFPWEIYKGNDEELRKSIQGIFTYQHPTVDGAVIDSLPNLKVISNFGVGVDHINLQDARFSSDSSVR